MGGQPTRYADPLGLWSTEAHNYFIGQTFKGLDPAMLAALKADSAFTDTGQFQDADHVFMHAMSSEILSPAESRRRMCQFIKDKRGLYQMCAQHGLLFSAFFEMGMALHVAMDSTSPVHRGFQFWGGVIDSVEHGYGFRHGPSPASREDIDAAPAYLAVTKALMEKAFRGQLEDCGCN